MLRRSALALIAGGIGLSLTSRAGHAQAPLTKVTFGTDWLAEAEHGGFYQALATGLYKKHGLDVTIRMGGPQANPVQLIATGVVDFQMSSGSFGAMNMVQQDVPVIAVAAMFQKDPQVLISHPGVGNDKLADMKGKPIMISSAARSGFWLFLKAKYGFTDAQIRPYTFSAAPFLADKTAIQQGFVSAEPYEIERVGHEKPVVNLLADSGFTNYSNVVLTQVKTVKDRPEIVRAFVEASIEGWYSYIYGDPSPGNAAIHAANPDMTQGNIDNAIVAMKSYGIVDSGDSEKMGIGAMTEARWAEFFHTMSGVGLYPATLDYKRAFTTEFVDKGYGLSMRKP